MLEHLPRAATMDLEVMSVALRSPDPTTGGRNVTGVSTAFAHGFSGIEQTGFDDWLYPRKG